MSKKTGETWLSVSETLVSLAIVVTLTMEKKFAPFSARSLAIRAQLFSPIILAALFFGIALCAAPPTAEESNSASEPADSAYKGPLCQERNRRRELKPTKCGPTTADRGRHRGEPAPPLVGQARESSPFTRKGRRITGDLSVRMRSSRWPSG